MAKLPEGLLIGAATSSYQIEGSPESMGKTPSVWDVFCREPGRIDNGDTGDTACDSWERWEEDAGIIKSLGLEAYRLSISWPRVVAPDGKPIREALARYRAFCKTLKDAGIKVCATLHHWDLPMYEFEKGGWESREVAYDFAKYAEICYEALSGVVDCWMTLNEPWCVSYLSYFFGEHAPGLSDPSRLPAVIHHLNLAHGLAVKAFREGGWPGEIGIAWNAFVHKAADGDPETEKLQFDMDTGVFTAPVFHGRYPDVEANFPKPFPVEEGDLEIISAPIDFYALNYYHEDVVRRTEEFPFFEAVATNRPKTDMGWDIVPEGLVNLLLRMNGESGGLPVMVSENGASYEDTVSEDGMVHDAKRAAFIKDHFEAAIDAINLGVPLKAFLVWSLLDNFEWARGYSCRFGIVHVDFETLKRTIKDSGAYVAKVIATRET